MGIIKRIKEKYFKEQEENNQEHKALLNKKLNTENILKLTDNSGQIEYFYIDYTPTTILLILQTGRKELKCNLKQLTGKDAGKDYEVAYPRSLGKDGCFSFNEFDARILRVEVKGFGNKYLDVLADNEFEEVFGRKVTLHELLELHNIEKNNQNDDLNVR